MPTPASRTDLPPAPAKATAIRPQTAQAAASGVVAQAAASKPTPPQISGAVANVRTSGQSAPLPKPLDPTGGMMKTQSAIPAELVHVAGLLDAGAKLKGFFGRAAKKGGSAAAPKAPRVTRPDTVAPPRTSPRVTVPDARRVTLQETGHVPGKGYVTRADPALGQPLRSPSPTGTANAGMDAYTAAARRGDPFAASLMRPGDPRWDPIARRVRPEAMVTTASDNASIFDALRPMLEAAERKHMASVRSTPTAYDPNTLF